MRFLAVLLFGVTQSALATDFLVHPWEDEFGTRSFLRLDYRFFSGTDNYDIGATKTPVSGLRSLSKRDYDFVGSFAFADRWAIYARLDVAGLSVDRTLSTASRFALGDQTLGVSYRVLPSSGSGSSSRLSDGTLVSMPGAAPLPLLLDLQFQLTFPAYGSAVGDLTTVALGDASTDFTLGAFLGIPAGDWLARAGAGLTLRTAGYAAGMPWSVQAAYRDGRAGFHGVAGLKGYFSFVTTGGSVGAITENGGSFLAGSSGPRFINAGLGLGYTTEKGRDVSISFAQTITGALAPSGFQLAAIFTRPFGPSAPAEPIPTATRPTRSETTPPTRQIVRLTPKQYGKANAGFVRYGLETRILELITLPDDNNPLDVRLDRGAQDGVAVGQVFDIFEVKPDRSVGDPVARGKITQTAYSESVMRVTALFRETQVAVGYLARRVLE